MWSYLASWITTKDDNNNSNNGSTTATTQSSSNNNKSLAGFNAVREKVMACPKLIALERGTASFNKETEADALSMILSDVNLLSEVYLHLDYPEVQRLPVSRPPSLLQQIDNSDPFSETTTTTDNVNSEQATSSVSEFHKKSPLASMLEVDGFTMLSKSLSIFAAQPVDEEAEDFLMIPNSVPRDSLAATVNPADESFKKLLGNISSETPLKVKFVISDANLFDDSYFGAACKQSVKLYYQLTGGMPQYGFYHTALIVGPWKVEFLNTGLCVPSVAGSKGAILCIDLAAITSVEELQEVRTKLAHVIVKWNTKLRYERNGNPSNGTGNCQHFVDDVLQTLGLKESMDSLPPIITRHIARLRETGSASFEFETTPKFRQKFQINEQVLYFDTHEKLDEFVQILLQIEPKFMDKHADIYLLLKAYDRAFWLRYKKRKDDDYAPCSKGKKCLCPFKNPDTSASFLMFKKEAYDIE